MKIVLFAASLLAGLPISAAVATAGSDPAVVTVSCFRGPWSEVIWDRPNPVFIDSLVHAGYDLVTAMNIAERVCRDPSGVNDSDRVVAIAYEVLRQTAAQRKR